MILEALQQRGPDELAKALGGLSDPDAQLLYSALITEIHERCPIDGKFWLRFVSTRDEADPDQSIKPFPVHKQYTQLIWDIFERDQLICLAKSRQMIVTWEACSFCVWWARYHPHQTVYWQTQDWPDACEKVALPEGAFLGRCHLIEANLPSWMRQDVKAQEGRLTYPNGSIIQAIPGGADKIRGRTASLIVEDEFAKQMEAAGVYAAIAPLIQKKAKVIVIGTPNGTDNMFATLWHGRDVSLGKLPRDVPA